VTSTPTNGRLYVAIVAAAGLLVAGESLWTVAANPPGLEWFILAALTLFTGSFTVKVPAISARISVSETFIFTSVLLFGPAAGTITVVLDALVISFWLDPRSRRARKVLFNIAAPAIAIRTASEAFFLLSGAQPGQIGREDIAGVITPVFAFALLYFLINTGLVARALAFERRQPAARLWVENFPGVSVNYFVGSSVAMLIVAYTDRIDLTVLSIIVPLLLVSYYTFRASMGRLDDANRHVIQMNDLYMSTIEALAMAVDAKDQITHGHIRRVQVFALELAKRLGISEERQLNAIATAALLHDMGKLAIPEHILNKPGRLTPAEFDKMKRHADIGADLLTSVRFPYPVVPIVRHHHENWDGTGYPTGISGTDIPLGARILSVVDCFDALTSDRPYRPRLTAEDAFTIVRERRSTMYDPLVVDTFIRTYAEIAPLAISAGQEARSLVETVTAPVASSESKGPTSLAHIRTNAFESAILEQCARDIGKANSVTSSLQATAQCLRQITPATVYALFEYDATADQLTCRHSVGDGQRLIDGLTIKLGERVTGWSAANLRASVNSDASLDLAQIASFFVPPLRSTICTPLVQGDRLIGVLSAYSSRANAFNESHQYAFEQVSSTLMDRVSALQASGFPRVVPFSANRA
jgi:putative nucleotidyltransferase with HDIG domain